MESNTWLALIINVFTLMDQGMMSVILMMTAVAADAFLRGFMGVGATVLTDICIGMRQM